ncbi:MAG: hypothetical protein KDN05_04735 [Verrucomicrobiae bacterium]|nr:hypothetical protein [Verrucomicrobiae bacterium]
MMHRLASARAGVTPADMAFIESLLAGEGDGSLLAHLWTDPGSLTAILDLKEIHRALLESPVALPVSPSLYFYVLVRHAFLDGGIDQPDLADYVAGVLVEKPDTRPDRRPGAMPAWITHAVDFQSVIQSSHGMLRFHLEVAAGDQFLVLTGLFPEFLEHRAGRHGAPDTGFYESFARQSYRSASNRSGIGPDTRELLGLLAETFPLARRALHRMSDRCLF